MASPIRPKALTRRFVGALARRLGRPQLIGALYPGARRVEEEALAMRAIMAAALPQDGSFVDVGANRGELLRDAVRIAPRGRHVAFEPIPALAAALAADFPTVDCRALALGAHAGTASFCHFRKLEGWSGLVRNPEISDERGAPELIEVEVTTLDAQLGERGASVLKLDVEGAELAVLEGARGLLAGARPLLIFEHVAVAAQLYGTRSEQVWDLLGELGYRVFSVTGVGPFSRERFSAERGVVNWLGVPGATSL